MTSTKYIKCIRLTYDQPYKLIINCELSSLEFFFLINKLTTRAIYIHGRFTSVIINYCSSMRWLIVISA